MLSPADAKAILKAFSDVFDNASLWTGDNFNWMMVGVKKPKGPKPAMDFSAPWNVSPTDEGLRRIAVKAPAEQAYVALAFRVPSLTRVQDLQASDRDALALLVLSAVFSGYDGARLERALTQGEQPVADSAGSSAMITGRGPALFLMTGVPAGGKTAQQVEDALRAELARVAREGISEAELARVKTQWIASTVYERDSVQNQAQELGSNWVQGFPLDAEERLLTLLRTITAEEVQAVAAKYFGDDQLTIATLLPQPLEGARKRPAPAAGARH